MNKEELLNKYELGEFIEVFDGRFIEIKKSIIKNNSILNEYSKEGWRILWYFMTRSLDGVYIETNLQIIMKNLNLSRHKTIKGIEYLLQHEIIYGKINNKLTDKLSSISDILSIIIKYKSESVSEEDAKIIPYSIAYKGVLELNDNEWLTYTILIIYHNYYRIEKTNEKDEIMGYAQISQQDLCELVGVSRNVIMEHLYTLRNKGYIKIIQCKNIKTNKFYYKYCINFLNNQSYIDKYNINANYIVIKENKLIKNIEIKNEIKERRKRKSISAKLKIKLLNKSARWVEKENKYIPSCQFCGKTALETTLNIDHIIPVSKGGKTEESNLQVLCEDCNIKKNDKHILIINQEKEEEKYEKIKLFKM